MFWVFWVCPGRSGGVPPGGSGAPGWQNPGTRASCAGPRGGPRQFSRKPAKTHIFGTFGGPGGLGPQPGRFQGPGGLLERYLHPALPCPALPPALPCPLPCPALPCPALPCPALPCPALPCPALPCPALPCPALPCPALPCPALPCPAPALPCLPCPALPCPALPCPALPCPALPCPALPCPALPCPALPCPALPCPALPCPALPCPALPCPALPCPALPCPALPCPALPCPALPGCVAFLLCPAALAMLSSKPHRVREARCLLGTLVSRRAAGTGREDPQPDNNPFQLRFCCDTHILCRVRREAESEKAPP